MASYVVLERRPAAGRRTDTQFVRDEFSFVALVFPLVWLLWQRLWFAAVMLLLVTIGIGMIGEYVAPGAAIFLAGLVVSFFVALEGPAWRVARFRRLGYLEMGAVVAPDLEEAELRWFNGRGVPRRPASVTGRARAVPPPLPASEGDMVFGFAGER